VIFAFDHLPDMPILAAKTAFKDASNAAMAFL